MKSEEKKDLHMFINKKLYIKLKTEALKRNITLTRLIEIISANFIAYIDQFDDIKK
jgi:hypothetical protein